MSKIFLYTTTWMIIPLYHSNDILFRTILFCNMIFSCLYWKYYTDTLRNIDKIFSILTLLLTKKIYMLPVLFPFLYYGKKALNKNNKNKHIVYHSIFRYIAFWICCYSVDHYSILHIIVYSILYVVHIGTLCLFFT